GESELADSLQQVSMQPQSRKWHPTTVASAVLHALLQLGVDGAHERLGRQERVILSDENRKVFRHPARFDDIDADLFERLGKRHDVGRVVELAAVLQAAGPGVN